MILYKSFIREEVIHSDKDNSKVAKKDFKWQDLQ